MDRHDRRPPRHSLYGTGEVAGPLLRNGRRVTCWNHDAYGYDDSTLTCRNPLYHLR